MTVRIRSIDYSHDEVQLCGELAWDDAWEEARPCVVVVHDAMKSDQGFEEERAVALAALGYAVFALDVYGKGVHGTTQEESYALMLPFQEDRAHLQRRLRAGLDAAASQTEVDGGRMAAIGYCFGGLSVLDLARWNAPVAGVVSFHGLLTPPVLADAERLEGKIEPKVLVCHGWDDPYVPPEMVPAFASEMTERGADWQLFAMGHVVHSFTNPSYHDREAGVAYDAQANRRSWRILESFLRDLFPGVAASEKTEK